MIKKIRGLIVLTLFVLAFCLAPNTTIAQGEGQKYIPQTGHWINGDFLTTYQSVPNPEKIFGYPITDAFQNHTTNRMVQYFERAHFELNPDNPPELRVVISLLGSYLYEPGVPLSLPENFPACQFFSESRHQVCYAFLDFFKANGGVALFGYPISEIEIHDGRMVQYFQRARFEWHPEFPAGERVTLSDLGKMYFLKRSEDPARLLPNRNPFVPQSILSLKVRAFPASAVTAPQAEQSLYVIVQDQNLLPVSNAQVVVTVKYPSGNEARFVMPLTDDNGVTTIQFSINEQFQGISDISVTATYDTLKEKTRTSFRIWW